LGDRRAIVKRRIALVLVLAAAAAAVPFAVTAQGPPDDVALSRVERTFGLREWNCIDQCDGYLLVLATPADETEIDLVVTATIAYRLDAGLRAWARLGRATGPQVVFPEPTTALAPGRWPLRATRGRADTTTLTWVARGLPAEGREYRLRLEFSTDGLPVPGVTAYSRKAALVAEIWSAGG
jgi:hypothetical protein